MIEQTRFVRSRTVTTLTAIATLVAVIATPVRAQAPATVSAPPATASTTAAPAGWTKATTVFVNTVVGSRTGGSARRLNESHAEMEAKGWRFLDLDTYNENGDLVGFFVTYVK
jgi:hypothetical protein